MDDKKSITKEDFEDKIHFLGNYRSVGIEVQLPLWSYS
tara:strand:+ start:1731 stop:1844 length:114 start_codon:yes stop_codon:yes gene_type:complete